MFKKIFPMLMLLFLMGPTFGVDLDEALPHYGPLASPIVFLNGVIYIPVYVIGIGQSSFYSTYDPDFHDMAPVDPDVDGDEIFTPAAFTIDGSTMIFGVLIDTNNVLPDYNPPKSFVDLDEALPHYIPPLTPLGPPNEVDKSCSYYGPIVELFADVEADIINIWLPLAPVDLDEALPHYSIPSCFSFDNNNNLCFIFASDGEYWSAPIEEMAPVDLDEALPHY